MLALFETVGDGGKLSGKTFTLSMRATSSFVAGAPTAECTVAGADSAAWRTVGEGRPSFEVSPDTRIWLRSLISAIAALSPLPCACENRQGKICHIIEGRVNNMICHIWSHGHYHTLLTHLRVREPAEAEVELLVRL